LIETAYREGERLGLAVWCEDEAGPYQAIPQPGSSWQPLGQPVIQPHEYIRQGTAKMLTLLHPASGVVRVKGVTSSTNAVLHSWLSEQLSQMVAALPPIEESGSTEETRRQWERWQEGLSVRFTLLADLPPLRALLILDNLAGHKTPEFVCGLMRQGIMPLYTPIAGSWLNMAESIQRIVVRRALCGQEPESAEQIMDWLEASARGWNACPTPFVWGGKRATRRKRSRERQHGVGGSGAVCRKPVRKGVRTNYSYGYVRDK
jgi:hypothetical protein